MPELSAQKSTIAIHDKLVDFEDAPSGSYLAIASQVYSKDDEASYTTASSPQFSLALTTLRERTTYSIIEEGKLEDGGLEAIRLHLADSENNHVLLKYKGNCALIQCVDERMGNMKRAKALVCGRLLVTLLPFSVVVIHVSFPHQLNDRLIRSKLSSSSTNLTNSSPHQSPGAIINSQSTSSLSPDVPQDASTFSDSPQLDYNQSSGVPSSSSLPETPYIQGQDSDRMTFLDNLNSYESEFNTSSLAFVVGRGSTKKVNAAELVSSNSFGEYSSQNFSQDLMAPFSQVPDRIEQRKEAERLRLGVPTPVEEDSSEDRSTINSVQYIPGISSGKELEVTKNDKELPSIPNVSNDNNRVSNSFRSSAYSWVLEGEQECARVDMFPPPLPRKSLITSRYSLDDLEKDRLEFLAWKRDQEEQILLKDRERENYRRMADEAKRERVLKKLMKEQQAWDNNSSNSSNSTNKAGGGGGVVMSTLPNSSLESNKGDFSLKQRDFSTNPAINIGGGQSIISSSTNRPKKKIRPPPLSPPPNVPPPKSPGFNNIHRLSFPGEDPKTPTSGTISSHESILTSLAGGRHRGGKGGLGRDLLSPPVITLEGHIRARAQSQGAPSKSVKAPTNLNPFDLETLFMPPFQASIEIARRKAKQLEEQGLEGESWLTRRNRQRSEEGTESIGIPVGNGWKLTEVEGVKVSADAAAAAATTTKASCSCHIAERHAEELQARQSQLAFQLSELQRKEKGLIEAEGLQRAKWARNQVNLSRLDAFERSRKESEEKLRRERVEKLQIEEKEHMIRLEEERAEAILKIQEEKEYQRRVDSARRERKVKIEEEEDRNRRRKAEAQEKLEAKAVARAALRKKMFAVDGGPVLAEGIVTVQSGDGMKLYRRWFELQREALVFYSSSGSDRVLDKIDLGPGFITHLSDAFEELQLPHSFSLQYHNHREQSEQTLFAYTESEVDKEKLLVGLAHLSNFDLDNTTL